MSKALTVFQDGGGGGYIGKASCGHFGIESHSTLGILSLVSPSLSYLKEREVI